MLSYWILFSIPAFFALIGKKRQLVTPIGGYKSNIDPILAIWISFLIILIGLRHEVGGDWMTYLLKFEIIDGAKFITIFERVLGDDPLYNIVQWISSKLGWGIYGTNLFCASIFSIGLGVFCKKLPRPWLGLTVAIPYLVIVVSMGYTRQAFALGLAMLGLVALTNNKVSKFVIYITLAATAHKSAIILLPIAGLAAAKNRLFILFWISLLAVAGYYIFLADSIDFFIYGYIELDYQSEGAFIRLAMNALPALIMLLLYKQFNFPYAEKRLWFWFGLISIGLMAIYFIFPSSSALDRVALYMLPLQIVVFSYLPDIFPKNRILIPAIKVFVVFYYAFVQFVWLNYAIHSAYWLPYQNLILL